MTRGCGNLGRPSLNPRWLEQVRRRFYLMLWNEFGSLYWHGSGIDEWEAGELREECEEVGLPMGYGRVQREPLQLNDWEARAQFRDPRSKRR